MYLHLWLHLRPDAVDIAMFFTPRYAILDALEEFANVSLSMGPNIWAVWYCMASAEVCNRIFPAEIMLYIDKSCASRSRSMSDRR